jgi:SAM-dependent methyltransferase
MEDVLRGARLLLGDDPEVVDDLEGDLEVWGGPRAGTYVWDNAWDQARRRLEVLEHCYDPGTVAHLERFGVGPGWRCLEVGAGGGSITTWLCARVAPGGDVVAVDLDTRFVDELDAPNLDVRRLDVVTDDLPAGGFDLVHVRLLLMHLHAREAVFDKLLACLAPGGWLLVEEFDSFGLAAHSDDAYTQAWRLSCAGMAEAGFAPTWARQLPGRMAASGLVETGDHCEVPFFRGASPLAEMMQLTLTQAQDHALAAGASENLLAEAVALLSDAERWFPAFATISVWGRRPG